jgi:hypothetical protein
MLNGPERIPVLLLKCPLPLLVTTNLLVVAQNAPHAASGYPLTVFADEIINASSDVGQVSSAANHARSGSSSNVGHVFVERPETIRSVPDITVVLKIPRQERSGPMPTSQETAFGRFRPPRCYQ